MKNNKSAIYLALLAGFLAVGPKRGRAEDARVSPEPAANQNLEQAIPSAMDAAVKTKAEMADRKKHAGQTRYHYPQETLNSALRREIARDNLEDVKVLLAEGADPNGKAEGGDTPLMLAARYDSEATMRLILNAGARADTRDDTGKTALMVAAWGNSIRAVGILLETPGIQLDLQDHEGLTALRGAIRKDYFDVARLLIRGGADKNQAAKGGMTLLMEAARKQPAMTALLLNEGADPMSIDDEGNTALHYAAASGGAEIIQRLLASKIAVNSVNKRGSTPLIVAAYNNNLEAAKVLAAVPGGVLDWKNTAGDTALLLALGYEELASVLIEGRSNINQSGRVWLDGSMYTLDAWVWGDRSYFEDGTLLIGAAFLGKAGLVKELIDHGVDLNYKNQGSRALYYAGLKYKYWDEVGRSFGYWDNQEDSNYRKQKIEPYGAILKLLKAAGAGHAAR